MTRICFISGGDHKYYPMLLEWIHSIRRFPQSQGMDICILNAGMTRDQIAYLVKEGHTVKDAEWPVKLPKWKIRGREFLKACVARPHIPDYFPGYDIYFWMDSDTWVQDWSAVEMFIEGAKTKRMTMTSQADRAYPRQVRVKWLGRWPWKIRGFYFLNAKKAFGFKTAKELLPYHVLLAGAFALHRDATHWARWQELLKKALRRGKIFTAEQMTLGVMSYIDGYEREVLPSYTHWLCEFKPLWDKQRQIFVEPYLPHQPIGILHISGWDHMRMDRSQTTDFKTTDGQVVQLSYRYPYYDGEKVAVVDKAAA